MTETVTRPLQAAEQLLADAEQVLKADGFVDMQPLQSVVDEACQALGALPPAEAKSFAPRLQGLIERLDILIPEMIASRDRIQEQLKGTATHRQAATAYAKAKG